MSSTTSGPTTAGWQPDPFRRAEYRWWDGGGWTSHVSTGGQTWQDEPGAGPVGSDPAHRVQRQVQQQAGLGGAVAHVQGGGTIWTEPVLVVNQKAKLIEITNEYAVYDQRGTQIAAVRQTGQSAARKVLRVVSNLDQFLSHKLEIVDATGQVQLRLERGAKFVKSTVMVLTGQGQEVGRIVQQNAIGKIRFSLESGGQQYGSLNAENWRAWNFNIQDHTGAEVARITKTWEGLAKTLFTTADNYVVQLHRQLEDPLRALVIASALSVDTALKQDDRGWG